MQLLSPPGPVMARLLSSLVMGGKQSARVLILSSGQGAGGGSEEALVRNFAVILHLIYIYMYINMQVKK